MTKLDIAAAMHIRLQQNFNEHIQLIQDLLEEAGLERQLVNAANAHQYFHLTPVEIVAQLREQKDKDLTAVRTTSGCADIR